METISLQIKVNAADAKVTLKEIRSSINEIKSAASKPATFTTKTDGIKSAAKDVELLNQKLQQTSGLWADIVKNAKWQVLSKVTADAIASFREALQTMKAVDDEMVTIRKVTGASRDELEKIEKQAYKTASAYGVAADEYLKFVSGFSRAGYGEQASALAELAAKTQIVGDTNAETAQQFLLSVDAAYKYRGNIEQLTKVLDGANEIDNKYATSIQKVAEGLGKVAPIAAQAHVGVDELTAAIGTITAVTQRSGTEAATALRALFLNIIGDTKTEIDEGVTWTTGEIAGLRDVIKVYAKDAYEAAQATGSVINPMKAIAGLSKSMKDGLLTEQQLMEMVSDIGGKLRTSQLLALIQNWDMYESMLTDFAGAAGSADKEVENALDSWTRKTEILKNKWTEFVSHLVETDAIKGALDGVIGLVELLDTDVGRFVITVAALTTGVTALGKGLSWLKGTELIKNGKALVGIFADIANGAGSFSDVLTLINPKILIVVAAVAALYGAYKLVANYVEKANRTLASFDEEIGGVNSQLESNKKRIEEINNMPWADRTSAILEEKAALEKENAELEKKLKLLDKEKTERAREIVKETVFTGEMVTVSHKGTTSGSMSTTFEKTVAGAKAYEFLTEQLNEYSAALERNGEVADSVREQYEKDIAASARMVEALKQMQDAGDELTDEQLRLIAAYDSFTSASDKAQNATKDYISELIEEERQSGATGKALYDLVAAQITASSTELDVSQQIAALQALAVQAGYTAQAIAQVFAYANGAGTYQADSDEIKQRAQELMESGAASSVSQAFNLAKKQLTEEAWGNLTSNYTPSISVPSASYPSGGGYSGGGSSSRGDGDRKNAQAQIKKLQKERDAELAVIQKQIDALKEQTEEEDRQAKLEEYKLEILKKQDAVMNARNERTVRQYNASTGQWEWVADATKVKKAEEDLENAKKELREYERKVEIDLAVDELKARQDAIKAAYQIKIDAWQDYLDGLSGAINTENQYLNQSVANNLAAAGTVKKGWEDAYKARENATAGDKEQRPDGDKLPSPGGKDESVYSPSDVSESDIKVMQAYLGTGIDGKWGSKSEAALKNSRFSSFDEAYKHFSFVAYDKAVAAVRDGNSKATQQFKGMQQQGYADIVAYASVARMMGYDEGGILKGMGGIKATPKDEIVLPPKLAAKMLTPLADRTFKARLGELGFLYGAETGLPRTLTGSSDNRSYTDNSGTRYQIGSIVMTEQQAKHTTIYEAAQQAHNLQAFNA